MTQYFPGRYSELPDVEHLRRYTEEELHAISKVIGELDLDISGGGGGGGAVAAPPLFYVDPVDGSSSNAGSNGAPFKYIQDAIDAMAKLNLGSFHGTIQLKRPTAAESTQFDYGPKPGGPANVAYCKFYNGAGPVTIQGDVAGNIARANLFRLIHNTTSPVISNDGGRPYQVVGVRVESQFQIGAPGSGIALFLVSGGGSRIGYQNVVFGVGHFHFQCTYGGQAHNINQPGMICRVDGQYWIHHYIDSNALVNDAGKVMDYTPAGASQMQAYVYAQQGGGLIGNGNAWTGSVPTSGVRAAIYSAAFVATSGTVPNTYMPGSGVDIQFGGVYA